MPSAFRRGDAPPSTAAGLVRLTALRELMRLELPDRIRDVVDSRRADVIRIRRRTPWTSTVPSPCLADPLAIVTAVTCAGQRGGLSDNTRSAALDRQPIRAPSACI